MKIKKGDQIIVTIGKDKGKKGKVEKVYSKLNKILIPSLNLFKKHMKKRDEKSQGGIITIPKPIDASKVALICSKCSKPTRIGYKIEKDHKERICRKCGEKI